MPLLPTARVARRRRRLNTAGGRCSTLIMDRLCHPQAQIDSTRSPPAPGRGPARLTASQLPRDQLRRGCCCLPRPIHHCGLSQPRRTTAQTRWTAPLESAGSRAAPARERSPHAPQVGPQRAPEPAAAAQPLRCGPRPSDRPGRRAAVVQAPARSLAGPAPALQALARASSTHGGDSG